MSNLKFSFTFKGKAFCLCCYSTVNQRRYYKVVEQVLKHPDFSTWDAKKQKFTSTTPNARKNNDALRKVLDFWESLAEGREAMGRPLTDGKELFAIDKPSGVSSQSKVGSSGQANRREMSLGTFLKSLIQYLKDGTNKIPSKNFQVYIALLHKLEEEGKILNVPVGEINDNHFKEFGKFLLEKYKGTNYLNHMKKFKTTINKARQQELTSVTLYYNYRADMPKRKIDHVKAIMKKNDGVSVLSLSQYEQFVSMDLSVVPSSGPDQKYYKELYRDFCMLMYETKIRPCDIVCLKHSDIHLSNGTRCFIIIPTKKKNYPNSETAIQCSPISDKAQAIIDKYKGKSKQGYILPFSLNNYVWDLDNGESFRKWHNRKQKQLQDINEFLKKVKVFLNASELTTYTFRHSAFTHALNNPHANPMRIAKEGGTSVVMLERNYYNHIAQ